MDKLTPKYELEVKNEISNVNNWFGLGEQLKMEHTTLEAIRMDHNVHGLAHQRNTMVHNWLKSDLTASWSKLCKALEKIHERFVAEEIRAKYIPHTASISTDDSEEDEEVKGQPEGGPHNGEENYSSDTTKPPPTQPAAYEVSDESSDEDHTLPEQHTANDSMNEADIAEEPTPPPPPPSSEPQGILLYTQCVTDVVCRTVNMLLSYTCIYIKQYGYNTATYYTSMYHQPIALLHSPPTPPTSRGAPRHSSNRAAISSHRTTDLMG